MGRERKAGAELRKRSCTSLGRDSKAHTGGIIRRKLVDPSPIYRPAFCTSINFSECWVCKECEIRP